jgi:hypothetical protein
MLKYSPMATSSFVLAERSNAERYEAHFSAFDFSAISGYFVCLNEQTAATSYLLDQRCFGCTGRVNIEESRNSGSILVKRSSTRVFLA